MIRGAYAHLSPLTKIILLLILILTCGLVSISTMALMAGPHFDVDATSLESMRENIGFMKGSQIIQSIFIFVIPSWICSYLFFSNPKAVMPGTRKINWQLLLFPILIMVFGQPFIGWLGWLNQQLTLPDSWDVLYQWISSKEEELKELTQLFISNEHWTDILINTLMLAIIPAIGEEWLFRGVLQSQLTDWLKSAHLAIFITAVIFSAIHIQFLTFLPRFVLGLMLGYMLVFTKNLWIPIIAHFTNNFMALMVFQYYQTTDPTVNPLDTEVIKPDGMGIIISLGLIYALMYLLKQRAELSVHRH